MNANLQEEISLWARMIAITDTYADLIENAGNNFRRQLTPQEACAVLVKNRGTIFDPHLVDLFKSLVLGDDNAWTRSGLTQGPIGQFPPEPFRYLGSLVIRNAIRRKERAQDRNRSPSGYDLALPRLADGLGKTDHR